MTMHHKILIANRGDVALRVLRTCQELRIPSVVVHSTADSDAMHVRLADESVCIGPAPSAESYLNIASIIAAAEITNATAIHPGSGFLSENPVFAEIVEAHGLVFIGPSPEHIRSMGEKAVAKKCARDLGLPVVPGSDVVRTLDEARAAAFDVGYPVLLKAVAGGGGRGIRKVETEDELEEAFQIVAREAEVGFKNADLYVEKFLRAPRHIEFQILGDGLGQAVHFGERDCSIQRRYQKIWEEAPSPALSASERKYAGDLVVSAMSKMRYKGLGTIEFLYEDGQFYFMEMNTRLQVEHPITEAITGFDLVREQILLALGRPLSIKQQDISWRGHAIECRINAEHHETFAPCPGLITNYFAPGGPGIRVDSHVFQGYKVPPYYDSLLAKVIAHDQTRLQCIDRLRRSLSEYVIEGVSTLIPLHVRLCDADDVRSGRYNTRWLTDWMAEV